ncbi:hypothetical protein GRI69_11595 [Erythrobacter vulgaris]|uniref:HTH luxR-type domain-containing protein n=1 Tax=Qipengyuania vulgaris TaxID=291985 RepID=A0A844XSI5_9SPHN|nr:hypothetical protein [Qipengyuania vulgaris]MXO48901.1 hypothetical protein [Qipengyuania vulgaris]
MSSVAFNHDPSGLALYNSGYNRIDPRRAQSLATNVGKSGLGQEFLRNDEIEGTRYFSDICVAGDVQDSVHGIIADDEFGRLTVSVQRGFSSEYFDRTHSAKLEALLPIIARYIRASKLTTCLAAGPAGEKQLFGCLVTADLEYLTSAKTGPRLGKQLSQQLAFSNGRLCFNNASLQAVFDKGVQAALFGSGAFFKINETAFRFSPMPAQLAWLHPGEKFAMLTVFRDSNVETVSLFAEAFEFSEQETRLLALLCDGHSLRACGMKLNVSYETVRWHVKNMGSKSNYSRTPEMLEAARLGNLSRIF